MRGGSAEAAGAHVAGGLAGTRGVRSAGLALGRDTPTRANLSVAIQIDPVEKEDPSGAPERHGLGHFAGSSQHQASGPSSAPSGADPVQGNQVQWMDMSAIAADMFEEFQMFKLYLEVRR